MEWAIFRAPEGLAFITTDSPFMLLEPPGWNERNPLRMGVGILTAGARKLFPLSARTYLAMFDPGDVVSYRDASTEVVTGLNEKIENYFVVMQHSREVARFDQLSHQRWLYRLALGQPHQEDFIEAVAKLPQDGRTNYALCLLAWKKSMVEPPAPPEASDPSKLPRFNLRHARCVSSGVTHRLVAHAQRTSQLVNDALWLLSSRGRNSAVRRQESSTTFVVVNPK